MNLNRSGWNQLLFRKSSRDNSDIFKITNCSQRCSLYVHSNKFMNKAMRTEIHAFEMLKTAKKRYQTQ